MKRSTALLALLLLIPASLPALTSEEAVKAAMENNHSLKETLFREKSATAGRDAARAPFLPGADLRYRYRTLARSSVFEDAQASSMSLVVSYNLFRGGGDNAGLSMAEALADASHYMRIAAEADLALEVKIAYIEVLAAKRSLATAGKSIELLERQLRDTSLQFREGMIAKNDLLRVEVELSSARQEVIEAEGDLVISRNVLERLMGVGIAANEEFQDFPGTPSLKTSHFEALKEEMFLNRSELKYLHLNRVSLEANRDKLRAPSLPQVDLAVSYDRYGDSPFPAGRDEGHDDNASALLTATWNLFNGRLTRNRISEAEHLVRAEEEKIRDFEAELVLQLQTALARYRVAEGKLGAAGTAVTQAEENYRVNENRLRHRQATTVDLLDASFFLTRARTQEIDARYDLYKAAASLERVLERPSANQGKDPGALDSGGMKR